MIGFERSVVPTVLSNRKNESGLILGACYSQDGSAVYTGLSFEKSTSPEKSSSKSSSEIHASPLK